MKIALLILALNSVLSAQTQSLADAAKQERARQKSTASKATFTNETLGTAAEDPAPEPPGNPAARDTAKPVADSEKSAGSTKDNKPRDEAWWRDAFKQARESAKRAEDRKQVLQLELTKLNKDLLMRSDIYNREGQLAPVIADKNKELAAAEKEAEQAAQKVTQLEDELRRSGAPAGWSR